MQIIKIDFYFSLTLQDKKVIVPLGKKQKEGTVKGVNLFWAAWGGGRSVSSLGHHAYPHLESCPCHALIIF